MSSYGPPGPNQPADNQPEDPYNRPSSAPPGMPAPPPPGAPLPSEDPTAYMPPKPPEGPFPPPPPPGEYPPTLNYPPPGGWGQPVSGMPGPPQYGTPGPGTPGPYGPDAPGTPYGPPGAPGTPYGPPGAYGPGAPPVPPYGLPAGPPNRRSGLRIALIIGAVVLLLFCLCGVLGFWALARLGTDSGEEFAAPAATNPTYSSDTESTTDTDLGQQFAPGDCVVNEGTASNARLRKVPCAPGTYEVLVKIPFTTDGDECRIVAPSADSNYAYDSPLNVADYVLCLRSR